MALSALGIAGLPSGTSNSSSFTYDSAGERALYNGVRYATYPMEATSQFAATYAQAEATGVGSVARVCALQPVLKPIFLGATAAKGVDVGTRALTAEGRDSLTVGDFTDLGLGLWGSYHVTGGHNGPLNPFNWELNVAGEVVDGQVTLGANKLLRYVPPESEPTPRYTHDAYVRDVLGRDAAQEKVVPTRWSDGRYGIRRYDGFDARTGTYFEGNTTPWGDISWEKFNDKITQIAKDKDLVLRESQWV
jgi:hypothetical protein